MYFFCHSSSRCLREASRGETQMTIYISLLIALVGLVIYLASNNPKVAEVGRVLFMVGSFVFLFHLGSQTTKFLGEGR